MRNKNTNREGEHKKRKHSRRERFIVKKEMWGERRDATETLNNLDSKSERTDREITLQIKK